jgi:hypothetical protein
VTELTATTRLLGVLTFNFDRLADRFAISNLRRTYVRLNAEFALHAINQDFQMQLAHTGHDGLTRLLICTDTERRILSGQTAQRDTHLLLVDFGLWLDRNVDDRLREYHALKNDRLVHITQRLAGGHIFQTDTSGDVTSQDLVHFQTIVRMHLYDTTDTLFLAANGVINRIAFFQHARVNTHESQLPHERVCHQLECQRREALAVIRFTSDGLTFFGHARHIRDIHR